MRKPKSPPLLYKYYGPERLGLFADFLVRFSQPAALNDPFEFAVQAQPNDLANAAIRLAKNVANPISFLGMAIGGAFRHASKNEKLRQLPWPIRLLTTSLLIVLAPILALLILPFARRHLINILGAAATDVQRLFDEKGAGSILVFSCSELWNSVPMWAHYAANHTGFAIGFDPSKAFEVTTNKGPTHLKPQPVKYLDRQPKLDFRKNSNDIFCGKFKDWSYEKEWRFLGFPDDAKKRGDFHERLEIALFSLTPSSIQEVIFGLKTPQAYVDTVTERLSAIGIHPDTYRVTLTDEYGFSRSRSLEQIQASPDTDAPLPCLEDFFPETMFDAYQNFELEARHHPVLGKLNT